MSALDRAYGLRRRPAKEDPLDRIMLAVLSEDRGERAASRLVSKMKSSFVDWNEVRVARPRDLAAVAPEAAQDRGKKIQGLLEALYENLGGLSPQPLLEKRPSEARAWLAGLGRLSREELEGVMMVALNQPVIPASEALARVLRRQGLVPRKSSRARAQRAALKGLPPEGYRDFYGLVSEHAATVCRSQIPDCARCKLRRRCRSKGDW
jgi:endonuclease-3